MRYALLCLLLAGCSTEPPRFMTAEQDAAMREPCSEGCAVIPYATWEQIKALLKSRGIGI